MSIVPPKTWPTDHQRAAFEQWSRQNKICLDFVRRDDGPYSSAATRCAWLAWQAAGAGPAQPATRDELIQTALATVHQDYGQSAVASPREYAVDAVAQLIDAGYSLSTPCPSTHKMNGDQTVAVSTEVYWNTDMSTCPRGVKVQLDGAGGVALYGVYDGKDPFYKGWAPVPRRRPT